MAFRRAAYLVLSLVCLLFGTGFGPPRLTDADVPRVTFTLHQIRAMRALPRPEVGATSALLADMHTGQILYARNERERLAPASLTKLVTALVAIQRGRQDQELKVAGEDLRAWSVIRLQNGEQLNLRQLLFAMLIPSDNAAAMTIARGLGGNVATYVRWMNEFVAQWGLQDTRFANPSGLDANNMYSTAYDMAVVARLAMRDPVIAEIVRKPEWIVAGRIIKTTNELLNTYPGTIGVKTGTTDEAGQCLITVVERPTGKALSVVMGTDDRFRDTRLLMDYFFTNFSVVHVRVGETALDTYRDEAGTLRRLELAEPLTLLVAPWQADTITFFRRLDNLSATPDPAQPVGALQIMMGQRLYREAPLYAR
ncbi:MAG: D-alanyl-D-alanine carboxypeptidase family protein [Chloroflexota bacterium]